MIDIEKCKEQLLNKYLESQNPDIYDRYFHSISVMEYSLKLAKHYGYLDLDKVILASIFHDYAKFETIDKYQEIIRKYNLDENILKYNSKILHALLGAYIVKEELGIDDEEVIEAIKYHTTGKANMSVLEKIIYVSDYAELRREGKMFDIVREASLISLDEAVKLESKLSIDYILERGFDVMYLTKECYDFYNRSN